MKSTTYDVPLLVITHKTEIFGHDPMPDPVRFCCGTGFGSDPNKNFSNEIRSRLINRSLHGRAEEDELLRPYTLGIVWRKLPKAIFINNKLVTRYKAPKIIEYVDLSTGEIFQASNLRNNPKVPPQIYVSEIQLLRQSLLASLRKEVREFAQFILSFRNNRRGTSPEINTLVEWYALIHNKRPSNVRRYIKVLQESSFFAGESLLSPLFQLTGRTVSSKDHLSEDSVARGTLMRIRMKVISRSNLIPEST